MEAWKGMGMSKTAMIDLTGRFVKDLVAENELLKKTLYGCICELEYVQSVENCHSGLCASAIGKEWIARGMKILGVKDLSSETFAKAPRT